MRVLVTRPLPEAERTAALLRACGHAVLLAPLLRFEPVPEADPGPPRWAGVLATSANALRAMPDERLAPLLGLPLLAVGRRTAEAARTRGFRNVCSADGNAGDLVGLAREKWAGITIPVLYLAGEDRAAEIERELRHFHIPVHTAVVYRMQRETALTKEACEALQARALDAVLHYSRRSAQAYLEASAALLAASLAPRHLCLSEDIGEVLRRAGGCVEIAVSPDETALLSLLGTR